MIKQHTHDHDIENAALIAAAPDLLDALEDVFGLLDDGFITVNQDPHHHRFVEGRLSFIRAAIAKAKGGV